MNAESEANIVFELSRHLQNSLDQKDTYHGIKLVPVFKEAARIRELVREIPNPPDQGHYTKLDLVAVRLQLYYSSGG